jgi:Protein of unknown function (DUF2726)
LWSAAGRAAPIPTERIAPLYMQTLPWIVALVALALLAAIVFLWAFLRNKPGKPIALPTEWALTARPVFSTDERRVYRLLREALPHHIVLSKLPLVRFCQPTDPNEVRYWFDLLGTSHVTFAVCSANGRVLAAIDLDTDRGNSRRLMQIKQSVLSACRVRYLRTPVDQLPSVAELQLLVPTSGASARGPQPAPVPQANLNQARSSLSNTVASRRAERTALWQDSTVFQDSFFAPDSRDGGGFSSSEFGAPSHARSPRAARPQPNESDDASDPMVGVNLEDEMGGVVVDTPAPRFLSGSRR